MIPSHTTLSRNMGTKLEMPLSSWNIMSSYLLFSQHNITWSSCLSVRLAGGSMMGDPDGLEQQVFLQLFWSFVQFEGEERSKQHISYFSSSQSSSILHLSSPLFVFLASTCMPVKTQSKARMTSKYRMLLFMLRSLFCYTVCG